MLSDAFQYMPQIDCQKRDLVKLHKPGKFH